MTDTTESTKPRSHTIQLAEPIMRGETKIESLTLRKPKAGELRGLTLQNVIGLDITTLIQLTPRISEPPLTDKEAANLEPEDLHEIGGAIRDFFMTKAERAVFEAVIAAHQPSS